MNAKEAAIAWANGEKLDLNMGGMQWRDYNPENGCDIVFIGGFEYRIKPRTIRIGEYDVPEPVREPLQIGDEYYTEDINCAYDPVLVTFWDGGPIDMYRLENGLVHKTRETAELFVKARLSLTRKGEHSHGRANNMSEEIMRESEEMTESILDIAADKRVHWQALLLSSFEVATISLLNLGLTEREIDTIAEQAVESMKSTAKLALSPGGGSSNERGTAGDKG